MKIFIINSGSSSIKYQLINMPEKKVLAKGLVDKVGLKGSFIKHKTNEHKEVKFQEEILDHQAGIEYIINILTSNKYGNIKNIDEIDAVGHRVVHGGEDFSGSVVISDKVVKAMEKCVDLAPLHNPPNLKGIYAITELLPQIPQVGVFDTAFHQTMPSYTYLYGLPYQLYEKYKIRRYGFHGTSHKYVSQRACEILEKNIKKTKIITCHLGNGASIAAIKNGKSFDTSMGMTPIEGLIMGTRCGDLDIGALLYIADKEKISIPKTNSLVNKKSGVLGISGISSDMRELEEEAAKNNIKAKLALDMYHYRVRKYIGAYTAAMGGVDIIVFTGGIGENADKTREEICKNFEFLGLDFDYEKNKDIRGKEIIISKKNSKVIAIVIPTDEEMVIAQETYNLIKS
ncbi:MAG: acetate kinase [Bacteroidales bacterium]|nr:acetate kinase [Bacteroidales bacterium]